VNILRFDFALAEADGFFYIYEDAGIIGKVILSRFLDRKKLAVRK